MIIIRNKRNIRWMFRRFRAMDKKEVVWRLGEKAVEFGEKKIYFSKNLPVTEIHTVAEKRKILLQVDRLRINWGNTEYEIFEDLDLFGVFSYKQYKKQWNAGFQTSRLWPQDDFSYKIPCGQREDVGDIRTNWELNRHYQFAALAKNFYLTGERSSLLELKELFEDWNHKNLFLHGVQWKSPMEIALRINSWAFTYGFLEKAFAVHKKYTDEKLLNKLSQGIIVMTDYVTAHFSRYSSANNHRIIESYAVGLAGILYNQGKWLKCALKILSEELIRQNCEDGVNKEMSLHYQCFIMEAYGILMVLMKKNNIPVPDIWYPYLENMSRFVADSCGDYGETVVFGDNDEGKILNLSGRKFPYYSYVLDLMGCVLPERYTNLDQVQENIHWLLTDQELEQCREKKLYKKSLVRCYKSGGYIFLRNRRHNILIGIDCAPLGFGSIAAHGHADALSFQLFVGGVPVFTDPGTYNYHVPAKAREIYRSTFFHNTVVVGGKNQSEMLGPFLWGSRAESKILKFDASSDCASMTLQTEYENIKHIREYQFNYTDTLKICDIVTGDISGKEIEQVFLLGKNAVVIKKNAGRCELSMENIRISIENRENNFWEESEYFFSEKYNVQTKALRISCKTTGTQRAEFHTRISIG